MNRPLINQTFFSNVVPIKWMAPETLIIGSKFTEKSDLMLQNGLTVKKPHIKRDYFKPYKFPYPTQI